MDRVIWKYEIEFNPMQQEIAMPKGARFLFFESQGSTLQMWVEVDPDALTELRVFTIVGTGFKYNGSIISYLGSAQMGHYVWHLFEKRYGGE